MAAARRSHEHALVADDDDNARALVRELLERSGWTVTEAADGEEALDLLEPRPALAVVEVCLPKMNGYEVCAELRRRFGDEPAIIFVSDRRTEAVDRTAGLLVGGDDYVVKPFDPAELLARVKSVLRSRGIRVPAPAPLREGPLGALTPRELQVLALLAEGLTAGEIALKLVISPRTVGTHIQSTLEKLGVHSRTQAVAVALRVGLPISEVVAHAEPAA